MLEFRTMGYMTSPACELVSSDDEDKMVEKITDYNGYNREKCQELKNIRRRIAKDNGFDIEIKDCESIEECTRPCSACEVEKRELVRLLEEQNASKRRGFYEE